MLISVDPCLRGDDNKDVLGRKKMSAKYFIV